ncbi:hypothetical protein PHLCEN_2v7815 [Hermanssonia centrifuga]|uniref:Uncharacterized protein n=1 Tax=Hermanssonia centrifuga TaxID=98765 RepID=A0A2R6NVQ0_9APHY|nr:hypothetical protein PHLCEN_2v7815 [Hermanssonia centrifuga]
MPLRLILDDVISGAVELRLPAVDLPIFMTNTLQAQGWEMKMDVEASWWYYGKESWTLSSNVPLAPASLKQTGLAQPTLVPSLNVPHSAEQARTSSEPMLSDTSVVHNSAPRECMMFTLDTIPYARLDAFIRDFQASLSFGTTAMLGFSTCSSSVSFLSTRFVLASIPFLPRRFAASKRSGKTYPSARRTVTPLLTSLDGIVKLLVSGPSPLAIESVQNVSKDYAKYLSRYVQDLTQAPDVRTKFVANWGIEGWREERLLATWEDALVNIGSLQRWVILVRK